MPGTEAIDLTIQEVIKKALAYRPDIIVAVDYAAPGQPQPLRFVPRDSLAAETLSIAEPTISFNHNARYDLQVDGVVLYYYWLDRDEEDAVTYGNEDDKHGSIAGVNVLKQTVPIAGDDASRTFALTTTALIDGDYAAEGPPSSGWVDAWHFWKWAFVNTGTYTGGFGGIFWWGYNGGEPVRNGSYDPAGGTHIIPISYYNSLSLAVRNAIGTVHDPDCHCDRFYTAHTYGTANNPDYWFADVHLSSVEPSSGVWLPCYAITPNAENSYGQIPGDIISAGLAEKLYDILNPLQYDGNIVRIDDLKTPAGICSLLRKLNIADTSDDLTTMNALVQRCSFNYFTGRQTIKFGPADHLEPKDFAALTRQNRGRDFSLIFPYS